MRHATVGGFEMLSPWSSAGMLVASAGSCSHAHTPLTLLISMPASCPLLICTRLPLQDPHVRPNFAAVVDALKEIEDEGMIGTLDLKLAQSVYI